VFIVGLEVFVANSGILFLGLCQLLPLTEVGGDVFVASSISLFRLMLFSPLWFFLQ